MRITVRQIGVSLPFLIDTLTRAISRRITSLWEETLPQVRNVFGFRHRPNSFIHYHNTFVQVLPRIDFRFLAHSTSHALVTDSIASIMAAVADAESVSIVGRVKLNVSIIKREVNLGTGEVISCIHFMHVFEKFVFENSISRPPLPPSNITAVPVMLKYYRFIALYIA